MAYCRSSKDKLYPARLKLSDEKDHGFSPWWLSIYLDDHKAWGNTPSNRSLTAADERQRLPASADLSSPESSMPVGFVNQDIKLLW